MALLILIPLFFCALVFPHEARSQASLQRVVITYSSRSIASVDLFIAQERGASEILAKVLSVDLPTALETYRISRGAFTTDGIPSDKEIREYLDMDAQILGLPAPVPASKIFDFSFQREVNQELGVK